VLLLSVHLAPHRSSCCTPLAGPLARRTLGHRSRLAPLASTRRVVDVGPARTSAAGAGVSLVTAFSHCFQLGCIIMPRARCMAPALLTLPIPLSSQSRQHLPSASASIPCLLVCPILHASLCMICSASSLHCLYCLPSCLLSGSPLPSSSPQQWSQQQQQQAAIIPQQQPFSSMTGPPLRVQPVPPQLAPAAAAAGAPSLEHPSTIPLTVEGDVIRDAEGRVLLEQLHPNLSLNSSLSRFGALVFGARSANGAAHAWDLTVGRVSDRRGAGG
jgi:hypothetical protein